MRLLFAGTPVTALPALRALLDSPRHEVVAVLTRPPAPAGRGRRPTPSPVAELALSAGTELLTPARPSDPDFLDRLTALAPDCAPVVAYGALLRRPALDIPRHGWVNLHFSVLPAWRGAAPAQYAIRAGDEVTGASTFAIEEGLDTGPVYGVITEPIRPTDTSGDLLARLAVAGAELLVATMDGIADGRLVPVPQPAEGVSQAPKLTPADVRVDWTTPALAIDRLIRAATPVPGAWTTFRDRRLKLGPVRLAPAGGDRASSGEPAASADLAAGELVVRTGIDVAVGTGRGVVLLGQVQPEGKAAMPALDWARGVRLGPADRLA